MLLLAGETKARAERGQLHEDNDIVMPRLAWEPRGDPVWWRCRRLWPGDPRLFIFSPFRSFSTRGFFLNVTFRPKRRLDPHPDGGRAVTHHVPSEKLTLQPIQTQSHLHRISITFQDLFWILHMPNPTNLASFVGFGYTLCFLLPMASYNTSFGAWFRKAWFRFRIGFVCAGFWFQFTVANFIL